MQAVHEVTPGVYHWTALHPKIHVEVSSYWLEDSGVLIDPLVPPAEGLECFAQRAATPTAILLSNRHHYRESERFIERFDCAVYCNKQGLDEFSDSQPVAGFEIGQKLPGGALAVEFGA